MSTFQLSVCAEMVYLDLPFIERVKKIHAQGYGVEIWSWTNKDIEALVETGARFTSMTGYISGNLTDDEDIMALLDSARESVAVAERLKCPALNLHGTGLDGDGLPVKPVEVVTPAMWLKAVETLKQVAEIGRQANKVFTLENLNLAVDHPGTPFATGRDTYELVRAVNSPHLKMNFDLYHAQIGEGNLIEALRNYRDHIGEIQLADVPGRMEPGTGEINYPNIAKAIADIGYTGTVAMEAWASGDSDLALERFKHAFS